MTVKRPNTKWPEPKRNGKDKSYDGAVWQYLLDHAEVVGHEKHKKFKITLYVVNQHDFEWRVKARMHGVYRNDEGEMVAEFNAFSKDRKAWKIQQEMNALFNRYLSYIDKEGKWYERVILWVYRWSRDWMRDKKETIV